MKCKKSKWFLQVIFNVIFPNPHTHMAGNQPVKTRPLQPESFLEHSWARAEKEALGTGGKGSPKGAVIHTNGKKRQGVPSLTPNQPSQIATPGIPESDHPCLHLWERNRTAASAKHHCPRLPLPNPTRWHGALDWVLLLPPQALEGCPP